MHLLIALYSKPLLAIGLMLALGFSFAQNTWLRGTVAENAMVKKSLHRAGYCARSTMPSCRVLLPDERPDRVVKEPKVQRARRDAAQAIGRAMDRER